MTHSYKRANLIHVRRKELAMAFGRILSLSSDLKQGRVVQSWFKITQDYRGNGLKCLTLHLT